MGFWDYFLFGAPRTMNVPDPQASKQPEDVTPDEDDDEAQYDDGYDDDYVGDGLDGDDDDDPE